MEYDIRSINGYTFYYKHGTHLYHREDGPAIEHPDGSKEWWINGFLHREDGPARDYPENHKQFFIHSSVFGIQPSGWIKNDKYTEWWINGKRLSPEKETILNRWWNNKNEQS